MPTTRIGFDVSRPQHAAREMLGSYAGIVIADGYGAYDALSRAGPGFTLAHCWAHVRRKFIEAEAHYPAPCRKLLELVGQLYAVERERPSLSVLDENNALRRQQRDERSRAIVGEIQTWALAQRPLPESSLGKASGTCSDCGAASRAFSTTRASRSITIRRSAA